MSPLAQYRGGWRSIMSLNERETQPPVQPHAPALPPQTLTLWAESQIIASIPQFTWPYRCNP